MRALREAARLTAFELAVEAKVSMPTIYRMEHGTAVTARMARRVLDVLGQKLGRALTFEDVSDLQLK